MENDTSTANSTHVLDLYCTELFVGPLVWAVFCVPCACVGVPASVWLLWVLIQRQRSGLSNDTYMLNLTIMDLIFNTYIILDVLNYFVWKDDVLSDIAFVLQYFSNSGRPLFMASVCFDCYMAVVHPTMYMTLKHSRYRMVTCAVIWAFTLVWGILSVLRDIIPVVLWPIPMCFALLCIALCDISIFCALRKPDPSGRSDIHPLKKRVLQVLTNSLVMAIVSFFAPTVIEVVMSQLFLSLQEFVCSVTYPVMIFSTLGSAILPLLHLGNLGNLKALSGCGCGTNNI